MKRTSAGRPNDLDTTAKAVDGRQESSGTDEDAATLILVLIAACLAFAILVMSAPDTAVLTADQVLLMPGWGP
jgi:hypothetical protein